MRYFMHGLSTLGCAVSLLPLALWPSLHPLAATTCLLAATSAYACSFGGFHAYVQVGQGRGGARVAQQQTTWGFKCCAPAPMPAMSGHAWLQ